ncbi:Fructose-1,6-bisphosphatase 1 [Hondaea fermentalgiana]|uniref:fructose-bisphosphatase n=1 Tax=Hondaea fermentalgiana TaxID=2315210 RepID=A0A2R5GLA7_9STRA|nr:Fructose-1,6-bisphosphatase 1 [Hondaea fermentalgiana]|eukprot:GBG31089.1 Fructose-1,6-bisphosphatase 1 [Hondaea fermentalgiana]
MAETKKELEAIEDALKRASVKIYEEIQRHIGWTGDEISSFVQEGATQKTTKVNTSGDKVLQLDMLADKHVEDALRDCPYVAGFASEEREDFVQLHPDGKYTVVFDPLDGSQNVPVNITVGAIFGVFKSPNLEVVEKGEEIVAAGYALFSTALQFAYCTRDLPVHMSQYNFVDNDWVKYLDNFSQPKKGKTYAINEGSCANWDEITATFVAQHLRGRSVRWMCCMVSDVARQMLQGGCFLYPADKKYPKGRLRLVYEAVPLAFMWERAGNGKAYATVEGERILDRRIPHEDIHARCGVIFLGEDEASKFDRLRESAPSWLGGQPEAKAKLARSKSETAAISEASTLRIALVIGAALNIALLYRATR